MSGGLGQRKTIIYLKQQTFTKNNLAMPGPEAGSHQWSKGTDCAALPSPPT